MAGLALYRLRLSRNCSDVGSVIPLGYCILIHGGTQLLGVETGHVESRLKTLGRSGASNVGEVKSTQPATAGYS